MELKDLWHFIEKEAIPAVAEKCNLLDGCCIVKPIAFRSELDGTIEFYRVDREDDEEDATDIISLTDAYPLSQSAEMHAIDACACEAYSKRLFSQIINDDEDGGNEIFFVNNDNWNNYSDLEYEYEDEEDDYDSDVLYSEPEYIVTLFSPESIKMARIDPNCTSPDMSAFWTSGFYIPLEMYQRPDMQAFLLISWCVFSTLEEVLAFRTILSELISASLS